MITWMFSFELLAPSTSCVVRSRMDQSNPSGRDRHQQGQGQLFFLSPGELTNDRRRRCRSNPGGSVALYTGTGGHTSLCHGGSR